MMGDFSRFTFDPKKHYDGVLMQQGRVQLDADWNEQRDIAAHRVETATIDLVGPSGAPEDDAGFGISPVYALEFDGVDDHVILPTQESRARAAYTSFTLDVQVRPRTNGAGGTVLSSLGLGDAAEYTLEVAGDGAVVFRMLVGVTDEYLTATPSPAQTDNLPQVRAVETRATRSIPFGKMSHLTVTVTDGQATIYVDGEVASASGDGTQSFRAHPPRVVGGSVPHGRGSDHFAGVIANLCFWSVALSATDVMRHHHGSLAGLAASLAGYWPLGEGVGITASDSSGYGNHGMLGGGVTECCPTWVFHDLSVGRGRYYVHGILCENERPVSLAKQPDDPGVRLPGPHESARYLAYLDVWKRNLTAIEDPRMREVGLGGPDTTTRLKTVWQVKLLPLKGHGDGEESGTPVHQWDEFVQRSQEAAQLRVRRLRASTSLGNQLYRVEIQTGDEATSGPGATGSGATFKWSRENGAVAFPIRAIDPESRLVTLGSFGRDCSALKPGDWVELTDDTSVLQGRPAPLAQIASVDYARQEIVLAASPPDDVGRDLSQHPLLRRWDQSEVTETLTEGAQIVTRERWLALEDGVQVWFEGTGPLRSGDFWLIPARGATEDVEWPRDASGPLPQPPFGVKHHRCLLAEVRFRHGHVQVHDHRHLFPPLTALRARRPHSDEAPASTHRPTIEEAIEESTAVALPTPSTEAIVHTIVEDAPADPSANGGATTHVVDIVLEETVEQVPPGFSILGPTPESPRGYAYTGATFMTFGRSRQKNVPMRNLGRLSAAVVDGQIFLIAESGEVWVYDPSSGMVEPRAYLRPARRDFGIAVAHRKIYLFGGVDIADGRTDRTSEYDPAEDRWTNRMPMRSPRSGLAGSAVDGKVYAIGGETASRFGVAASRLTEEYDPHRDRWSERDPMPTARTSLHAVAIGRRIYAIGGETRSHLPGVVPGKLTITEQYDPKSNTWQSRSAAPNDKSIAALAALDGKLYALGIPAAASTGESRSVAVIEEYDPAIDYWTIRSAVATPRHLDGLVTTTGELHIVGKDASDERIGTIETIASAFYIHRRMPHQPRPRIIEEPSHARI